MSGTNTPKRFWGALSGLFGAKAEPIQEIIGQSRDTHRRARYWNGITYDDMDIGTADYAFYDRLRNGRAEGFQVSGLFAKPIESKITAWTLGNGVKLKSEITDTAELEKWWDNNLADISGALADSIGLGDSYIVVNADLTLTVIPPNIVTPIVSPNDYSEIIGYRVAVNWSHPTELTEKMTIIDEFRVGFRTRIYQISGITKREEIYDTPFLDRLPIIPVRNRVKTNEVNGTPEIAPAVPLLYRYNNLLDSSISGVKRSTPVAEFPDEVGLDRFWSDYSKQAGTVGGETEEVIDFDSDDFVAIVGKFYYANPASMAGDSEKLLVLLYLTLIEHLEIPEFVMGSAIASSKASAESQMPVFTRFIENRRNQSLTWARELLIVIQQFMVARGELGAVDEEIGIGWEALTNADGTLTLATLQWAYAEGLIDKATALKMTALDIDDVEAVLAEADAERPEQPNFQADLDQANRLMQAQLLSQGQADDDTGDE